jgi:heat shock protein HslJ
MSRLKKLVWFGSVLCALTLALAACGAQSGPPSLEGTQWSLVSFGPAGAETPLVEESTITLTAADGQVEGSGGCNSYGGEYQVQGNEITFENVTSTLLACSDELVTQQEQQYFQALNAVRTYELGADRLNLYGADGQLLLTFTASPSP